jgi:hypothetical protein
MILWPPSSVISLLAVHGILWLLVNIFREYLHEKYSADADIQLNTKSLIKSFSFTNMKRFFEDYSFARGVDRVALPGTASPDVRVHILIYYPRIIPTNVVTLSAGARGSVPVLIVCKVQWEPVFLIY